MDSKGRLRSSCAQTSLLRDRGGGREGKRGRTSSRSNFSEWRASTPLDVCEPHGLQHELWQSIVPPGSPSEEHTDLDLSCRGKVLCHVFAQILEESSLVGEDGLDTPACCLDHLVLAVDGPNIDIFARLLCIGDESLTIGTDQACKVHGEAGAVLPEVLARRTGRGTNVNTLHRWDVDERRLKELGVPQAKNETRRQVGLELGVGFNDFAHKREKTVWVVVWLDVKIELDVLAVGTHEQVADLVEGGDLLCGLLEGTEVLDTVLAKVWALVDQALAVSGSLQCWVVEHDDDIVSGNVYVGLETFRSIEDGLLETGNGVFRESG